MMPVIIALPLRNVTRKLRTHEILIEYLIDLSFRMYPTPCCIELPAFRIFASGCGSSGFRFRSFFLCFRRIILLNGSFFFRLWRIIPPVGSSGFRLALNFRFLPSNIPNWRLWPLNLFRSHSLDNIPDLDRVIMHDRYRLRCALSRW